MHIFGGTLQQQDITVAYPTIVEMTRTSFTSNATTHNCVLPTPVAADDLLMAVVGSDGSATVSASGYTLAYSAVNGADCRLSVLAKIAVGNEDGTTVNVATSASEQCGVFWYCISGWGGTIATDIVFGTEVTGTLSSHDPPSLTSGFGAVPTLWFAMVAASGTTSANGYDTNYTKHATLSYTVGSAGSTAAGMAACVWRPLVAASENPGAFTYPSSTSGLSNTMAVRGV